MSELDYIGPDELVFNSDIDKGIHSGGFRVKSIMMKSKMSPIMTLNSPDTIVGGGDKVSDLFNDLVVPNWVLSYNNRIIGGGKYKEIEHENNADNDEVIEDDLHEKLLELVKHHNTTTNTNHSKKRMTRRFQKSLIKKGGTKKRK